MRIRGAKSPRPATCGCFKRDGSWVVQRTRVRWFLWRWINLRTKPSGFRGSTRSLRKSGVLVVGVLLFLFPAWVSCSGQGSSSSQASGGLAVGSQNAGQDAHIPVLGAVSAEAPAPDAFAPWQGLPVRTIAFEGVPAARLEPLAGHLPQAAGTPFDSDDVRRSLRQLFATGLYDTIEVTASPAADGVALVFKGTPRTFLGTVSVDGARGSTMNTQLVRASQLVPGTRFTPARLKAASRRRVARKVRRRPPAISRRRSFPPPSPALDRLPLLATCRTRRTGGLP